MYAFLLQLWFFSFSSCFICKVCCCCSVTQLCPTLCNPMVCSPPGSSVHGILQARILECIAIFFPRGSYQPRNQTLVSCIAGRFFTNWATREALNVSLVSWGRIVLLKTSFLELLLLCPKDSGSLCGFCGCFFFFFLLSSITCLENTEVLMN